MENKPSVWLYIDSAGVQKGPVPPAVLLKLFEKGLGGISGSTMVWQAGAPEWSPMSKVRSLLLFELCNNMLIDNC